MQHQALQRCVLYNSRGRGAPLLDSEIEELRNAIPVVERYLSPEHREVIARDGFFEGSPGAISRPASTARHVCSWSKRTESPKCGLEQAFFRGESTWQKPLSCHLFPIRIDAERRIASDSSTLANANPLMNFGASTGTYLSDFVREALTRAYGTGWVQQFTEFCRQHRADGEPLESPNDNAESLPAIASRP